MKIQDKHIALLVQSFKNELNETERLELDTWLQESKENREHAAALKVAWENAGSYKSQVNDNAERVWERLDKRMNKKKSKQVSMHKNNRIKLIAASVALLFTLTFSYLIYSSSQMVNIRTADNERREISLPDGSSIWLNQNSVLSYEKDFETRKVFLDGEAYFDVKHDSESPFMVRSGKSSTEVLGTTFNVKASNGVDVSVALFTGKVAFTAPKMDRIIMAPGEQISYNNKSGSIVRDAIDDVNILSWQTGILKFDKVGIINVVQQIEAHYDREIILVSDIDNNCTFTGNFDNIPIEEALEIMAYSFDGSFEAANKNLSLSIPNCN